MAVAVACWIAPASSAASGDKEGVGYGSNLEHVYGNSSGLKSASDSASDSISAE